MDNLTDFLLSREHLHFHFREWLKSLFERYVAFGWELVEMLPGGNNVYEASQFLKLAEKEGWIERGKNPSMSLSQRAFAGLQYTNPVSEETKQFHAEWYGWGPGKNKQKAKEWMKNEG